MANRPTDKIRRWRARPDLFVREVFGVTPEPWQAEALRAITTDTHIAIRSGHGVGKSTYLAWLVLWFLVTHSNARVPCTAPTAPQLRDVLWAEIRKWWQTMPKWLQKEFRVLQERIECGDAFAVARTAQKNNPEALQGFHAQNLLFIIDEASGVEEIIFQVAEGALSSEDAKVVMTANPTRTSGYFYDAFHRMKHRWRGIHVSCHESSQVSPGFIADMQHKYGEDSDVYRVRVKGDFPTSDTDTVIPLDLIESAATRDVEPVTRQMPVWGCDVARYGNARTVLCKRRHNIVAHEDVKIWRKRDTMEVAGLLMHEFEEANSDERPASIAIDSIGIGAGVFDRCLELGLPVISVNAGESPSGRGRYLNLRAELWWRAREWLEDRDCRLEHEELGAELSIVKYQITSSGKLQIESKEKMMDRGVESPDIADAFVLTFAGVERRKAHGRYERRPPRQSSRSWAA